MNHSREFRCLTFNRPIAHPLYTQVTDPPLSGYYAALRQKYEAQVDGYNSLRSKYHSLKATLEQRTSELQRRSEVVNTLWKLNEEVQQTTTFMTECRRELSVRETTSDDRTDKHAEVLGIGFTQLLGTNSENPILVEMTFRAYLIYELYELATPWSIGQEEQSHNVYMGAIYQRMREAGQ